MWPRRLGSWVLPASPRDSRSRGEQPPTVNGTASASAGIFSLSSNAPGAFAVPSRLHSYGRVRMRTVSRIIGEGAGFVLMHTIVRKGFSLFLWVRHAKSNAVRGGGEPHTLR